MRLLEPLPPPYDPLAWAKLPLGPRLRLVCEAWAKDGYGAPALLFVAYGLKILLYGAGWVFFVSFHPDVAGLSDLGRWWLEPFAFQKAILWSLLFEVLGLGCGSGPLTGRYLPPFGGALYFFRPGTTKLPLFPGWPGIGAPTRGWLDAALYGGLLGSLLAALVAPEPPLLAMWAVVLLLPALGVLDRTIFLAARAEHYGVAAACLLAGPDWIAGNKAVWLALWFWAGVSKLNRHFPYVVAVMLSNHPIRMPRFIERIYQDPPRDLAPSPLCVRIAHVGTFLELATPICLGLGGGGLVTVLGFGMMLVLHFFITSSIPMGVPLEWNVMMVYGAFFLFGVHAEVSVISIESAWLLVLLIAMAGLVPLAGNLFPHRVSFLLSMRYYAGNWPYGVWLFSEGAHKKLDRLKKSSPWVFDQLTPLYGESTAVGLVGKVLGFRAMHLHGRALQVLLPRAVDRFERYTYLDGEIVAGMVLGYNFGDGHLHNEQLLAAVQAQCEFGPGELRCVFIEPQALFGRTLAYRIRDANTGLLDVGTLPVEELARLDPWPPEPMYDRRRVPLRLDPAI